MEELVRFSCATQYRSHSTVLKRKQVRACAFIVFTDLCDELATVDHLTMNPLLTDLST